jgi:hypothetical protein
VINSSQAILLGPGMAVPALSLVVTHMETAATLWAYRAEQAAVLGDLGPAVEWAMARRGPAPARLRPEVGALYGVVWRGAWHRARVERWASLQLPGAGSTRDLPPGALSSGWRTLGGAPPWIWRGVLRIHPAPFLSIACISPNIGMVD